MNTDDRGGLIRRSRKHPVELHLTQAPCYLCGLFVAVCKGRIVIFRGRHLQVLFQVGDFPAELLRELELLLDVGAFAKRGLSLGLVVPEARSEGLLRQFVQEAIELGDVKDAPLAPQSAFRGPRWIRVFR